MAAFLWIGLPLFIAAGSALLAFYIMQARMEVVLAQERELSAQTRAQLACHEKSVEDKVKAAKEEAERRALDNFLGEFRVEERHYLRESKSLFLNRKSMVLEERLYFRNIPLSNWVEHEMTVEEGSDVRQLSRACSIFSPKALPSATASTARGTA
jgi:outer membrane murein-binding lipoprotein Lpp